MVESVVEDLQALTMAKLDFIDVDLTASILSKIYGD